MATRSSSDPRLPPLDGGVSSRGNPAALPLRRAGRVAPGLGRHPRQGHGEHARDRRDQPQQPDRGALPGRDPRGDRPVAREHKLIVYADEIYDKVLYDGGRHTPSPPLRRRALCHAQRALENYAPAASAPAGWCSRGEAPRAGLHRGAQHPGLDAPVRELPAQYGIQTALGGYQSINDLVAPEGRLTRQRNLAWRLLNEIPG